MGWHISRIATRLRLPEAHPELLFEEKYVVYRYNQPRKSLISSPYTRHAHDVLTDYVTGQGFDVKRNYILSTGWEAKFIHGNGGRTIGVNSGDRHPLPSLFCRALIPDLQRWTLFLALAMPVATISSRLPGSPSLAPLRRLS